MQSSSGTARARQRPQAHVPNLIERISLALGKHIIVIAVIFSVLMFFCSMVLDWWLLAEHESRFRTVAISDALAGVIAGALVYKLLRFQRERRERMEERLQTIGDMNHHIRNALQVIAFSVRSGANQQALAEIDEAVNRIQWTLREILPKVEPTFEPFEGSVVKRFPTGTQGPGK